MLDIKCKIKNMYIWSYKTILLSFNLFMFGTLEVFGQMFFFFFVLLVFVGMLVSVHVANKQHRQRERESHSFLN